MNTDEPDALLRLTGAISDRDRIDWDHEVPDSEELSELEPELRAIESIASLSEKPADSGGAPPPLPDTWGTLLIRARLGDGGFGEVFRAYDPTLGREVALKLLKPERLTGPEGVRFLDEARRMALVRHPHVVTVHGADSREGRIGVWMELVDGRTLEQVLRLVGPFSPYEATVVGMQLCRALAAVHGAGVVHLDVKTNNVLRERGGRIVLMDFGAGRELRDDSKARPASQVTPVVMPPELTRGEPVGPAADLYQLGALLFRLVSQRYPVEARSVAELAGKHERGEVASLRDLRPDLPPEFVRIVERALQPQPDHRFRSAGAMEGALAMAAGAFTRTELGPGVRPAESTPAGRPVAWMVASFLAGLLLGVLVLRLLN